MSAALKTLISPALVREISEELRRVHVSFDSEGFIAESVTRLGALELTGRAWKIADALNDYLPKPFAKAAGIIEASLGPEIPATGNNGLAPLRYMPHVFFVQRYGLEDFEAAIRLQAELTKRFSAESSIRAFLTRYPERTYAQMLLWAADENAHLRRLASEGSRPRLPWAPRLRAFQEDPKPVLTLLELLKDDPVRYVQRSVANNLNDISKDHPALMLETCRRWADVAPTTGRLWIVKHALRSLVKSGHRDAIRILGGAERPQVKVGAVLITPKRARLGGDVRFSFDAHSTVRVSQRLLIDYAVHFVKANGATRPKFFKLRALTLEPGESVTLSATVSLAPMTTRRVYPGKHRIEARINGEPYALGIFHVTA